MGQSPNIIKFKNGFKIALLKTADSGSVSIQLRGLAGSNFENMSNVGSAHLLEHVLCSVAQQDNSNLRYFYKGGKLIGITSRDDVIYAIRCLGGSSGFAIKLLYKIFTYDLCSIKSTNILSDQKVIVKNEIQRYKSLPEKLLNRSLYKLLYPNQRISYFNSGELSHITKLSLKKLVEFKKIHYVPSNFILTITGNFNENNIIKICERSFGRLKTAKKCVLPKLVSNSTVNYQHFKIKNKNIAYIKINYYGYKVRDHKKYAAVVLMKYIDTNLKSIFSLKTQSIHAINCSSFSTGSYGFLDIFVTCGKNNIEKTIRTIKKFINSLESNLDQKKVTQCINSTVASFYFEFEKTSVKADYYAELTLHGNPKQNHITEVYAIKKVTIKDILGVIKDIKKQKAKITVASE